MLDLYFRKPVLWDYLIAIIIACLIFILQQKSLVQVPNKELLLEINSDLSVISLTFAGFILTLLTVFIAFKSSSKSIRNADLENESLFDIFFSSRLYFETMRHFQNCIKSLVFIALLSYILKLQFTQIELGYVFAFSFSGLFILVMTLNRSLLILSKIIKMQEKDEH
jgi:hypothetical protein